MVSSISESKAFQDGWQVRTHATLRDRVRNLNGSLTSIIDKLLKLRLVELQDVTSRHSEVSLKLELVLVHVVTIDLLKIEPVLNASQLMIGQCSDNGIYWWIVHLVRATKHFLCALLLCFVVHSHTIEVLLRL